MADLIRREASVLAATTTPGVLAAKAATTTIPIVFATDGDPVRLGLTDSLSRPGGNITGVTTFECGGSAEARGAGARVEPGGYRHRPACEPDQSPCRGRYEGIRKQPPTLSGCSSMYSTPPPTAILMQSSEPSRNCAPPHWSSPAAIRFSAAGPSSSARWRCITGCPRSSSFATFATAGGLASYGGSFTDSYRQVGVYTGRILKGEKPADLPVQQSTKLELIINLKTAKALGLEIPPTVLARADEVIE